MNFHVVQQCLKETAMEEVTLFTVEHGNGCYFQARGLSGQHPGLLSTGRARKPFHFSSSTELKGCVTDAATRVP